MQMLVIEWREDRRGLEAGESPKLPRVAEEGLGTLNWGGKTEAGGLEARESPKLLRAGRGGAGGSEPGPGRQRQEEVR